ncbi:2Fe-2S iron-sulfur cluster-binding protein [Flavimaricola marinus]|uniref:1,2-phenylacetyl-CoA epoxidase, subunit E n=1 Tax=Flavimaricola marinus TaxID=1819565 RepID=A0A238LK10_9RHOB|nr:2Fe-2S iron-sulfur cluster-binding protein [Flavimaricola marinus]SMY10029.1 1,2-phenylacetyl-CoA epoxidase, subunit E [Flavimaricola marinus]
MARFQTLKVTEVRKTIRDAVVVTLEPANGERVDFIQGQYLTFRRDFDGTEVRRSYSICAGRDDGVLQVGIKKVDGGAFSTWANEDLAPGDLLEAMPPLGNFHVPLNPELPKTYLGFAGGSGITPVLSIMKTTLAAEPQSVFTLVYANRAPNTIMFREELEALKNRYMGRLTIVHVLESGAEEIELFSGRVDPEKCAALFQSWIDVESVDTAFICGPEPMMLGIASALREHGLTDDQIKFELFASGQPGRLARPALKKAVGEAPKATSVTMTIDGVSADYQINKDQTILEGALENAIDAPYSCRAGVCSTCRCRIVEGEVEMLTNHALEDGEIDRGFALACQSFPLTDRVVVEFDH